MMEFEEMQKVWNEQKGETMYQINESALHRSVSRKRNAASRRINRAETKLSVINGVVSIFMLIIALRGSDNWTFVYSGIFAASVLYTQYFRWNRKKAENAFDRSLLGELDHAISIANSIIRFNFLVFAGFVIPIFAISFSKMIVKGAPRVDWLVTSGLLLLAFFLVRKEQKACHLPRRRQLLDLKKKLMEE